MQPEHSVPKKGMSAWAWVAIGCVGIVVLGAVAVGAGLWWVGRKAKAMAEDPTAAIEMIAAMNPDIEVVDRDADSGKVTLRDKKTGQTVTVDMEDIRQGRIGFSSDEGTSTVDLDQEGGKLRVRTEGEDGGTVSFGGDTRLPSWLPTYPGATTEGVFNAETAEASSGTFSMSTADGVDEVFDYLKGQLEGGGYEVSETRYSGTQGDGGMLQGETADGKRSVMYTLSTSDGKTQVGGTYNQKKG
jgi:hypothetical protein